MSKSAVFFWAISHNAPVSRQIWRAVLQKVTLEKEFAVE